MNERPIELQVVPPYPSPSSMRIDSKFVVDVRVEGRNGDHVTAGLSPNSPSAATSFN